MSNTSTHVPESPESITGLSETEQYRLLSVERRRLVLDILEGQTATTLDRLASAVVRREPGLDPADVSATQRVRVSLHHKHLPLMAELGVLEYDDEANRIRL
ncbi:hypothetical protein NDI56_08060 [Haloarcula sp. S1CR25-12]|uniref:DUF7344 domain-containing protein n=1 Tax=Haloarcula saliterrae TaxID=2950534 RepID=A0ABU2FAP5_9EURY|nr:hypothetical protein [Haloarcula sp. S1CR25-12]MDS0259343.1 hypothetical protein [Haloarcula sp. S1CR25-12]